MAFLFGAYGFPLVAIAKVVLLAHGDGDRGDAPRRPARPRLAGAVIAAGIIVGLVGGLSNSAVLAAVGARLV